MKKPAGNCTTYRFLLLETLEQHWQRRLQNAVIQNDPEGSGSLLLVDLPDQAALRGFMNTLWNYNLSVVQMCRLDTCEPPDTVTAEMEVYDERNNPEIE